MDIAAKLADLGLELPKPAAPVAAYVPVVEAGGLQVVDGATAHDPIDSAFVAQRRMFLTEQPQQLGATAFEETQPVGVVDDARGIGVFVIHTTAMSERLSLILRAHTLVLTPRLANRFR